MALTSTEKALCSSLRQKFSGLILPAENASPGISKTINDLKNTLRTTQFSTQATVNMAINNFKNDVNGLIPGSELDDLNKIKAFMENCPFFDGENPVSATLGAVTGIFDKIGGFLDNISISVPEFGVAKILDRLNALFSGAGTFGGFPLSKILEMADKLINCLSAICGEDVTAEIGKLNSLYSKLNMISDPNAPDFGSFNFNSILTSTGTSPTIGTRIQDVSTAILESKTSVITSVESTVGALKALNKLGV